MTEKTNAMATREVPAPTVMPVDRVEWSKQLNITNFVNTYYQFRDLQRLPDVRRILIVGPGQGLDTQVLRWRGYDITTFDIDSTFTPDYLGSVHDLHMFRDREFDALIASHVLEHLAVPYLDAALGEIARVARFALVYLPTAGRHGQLRVKPGIRGWDWSVAWDLFNYAERPEGSTPKYRENQHFWEVGMVGFRVKDLMRRFTPHFEVLDAYRNPDWIYSYNFVLRSLR
jgi:methyltransferase family protein